jgi:hypothetical protein
MLHAAAKFLVAGDVVMNADDIKSICALPPGTLQNKGIAFKFFK